MAEENLNEIQILSNLFQQMNAAMEQKNEKTKIMFTKKLSGKRLILTETKASIAELADFIKLNFPDKRDNMYILIDGVELQLNPDELKHTGNHFN